MFHQKKSQNVTAPKHLLGYKFHNWHFLLLVSEQSGKAWKTDPKMRMVNMKDITYIYYFTLNTYPKCAGSNFPALELGCHLHEVSYTNGLGRKVALGNHEVSSIIQFYNGTRVCLYFRFKGLMFLKLSLWRQTLDKTMTIQNQGIAWKLKSDIW